MYIWYIHTEREREREREKERERERERDWERDINTLGKRYQHTHTKKYSIKQTNDKLADRHRERDAAIFTHTIIHVERSSHCSAEYIISVCLSICLPFYLSVFLSLCLTIYLPFYLSVCLPFCLSVCFSSILSFCLYKCPFVCF
jgi:hypothetical protein